jgi:hypothetical protein
MSFRPHGLPDGGNHDLGAARTRKQRLAVHEDRRDARKTAGVRSRSKDPYGLGAAVAFQECLDLIVLQSRFRRDPSQDVSVADVAAVSKLYGEETFNYRVLDAFLRRQPDQTMGVKCVGRALHALVMEIKSDAPSGFGNLRVKALRTFP